jgi:hypothetical protein
LGLMFRVKWNIFKSQMEAEELRKQTFRHPAIIF